MSDLSDWLTEKNLAGLARFTNQELGQVTVTDEMTGAAMEYVYSLYDPLMSTHLMEEVFRIIAVLQPKDLVTKVELL